MKYLLVIGAGYLPGASNATILLGWWAGLLVAIHDIGKSLLAVLVTVVTDYIVAGTTRPSSPLPSIWV